MKLTQPQIEQFHRDGYILLKGVFTPAEIQKFQEIAATFPQASHYAKPLYEIPEMETIWADKRLTEPASQLIDGPLVFYFDAQVSRYLFEPGEHTFGRHLHHDAKGSPENVFNRVNDALDFTYPVIRVGVYFQDTTSQSGGLKIVPGSHRVDCSTFDNLKLPCFNVPSEPGDVIMFTHRLLHSPFALRPKDDPSAALLPRDEDVLFARQPEKFLPQPLIRETIFFNYAAVHEFSDLHIKYFAVRNTGEPGLPEYLVDNGFLEKHANGPILFRVDQAILRTVVAVSECLKKQDRSGAEACLLRLPALCRAHWDSSPHHRLEFGEVLDATLDTGIRLFNEILPQLERFGAMDAKKKGDPHMSGMSKGQLRALRQAALAPEGTQTAPPVAEAPYNPRRWSEFNKKRALNFPVRKILRPDSTFFTMGSCFAMQIRRAMAARGLRVYPDYAAVQYDRASEVFDKIPEREALQHYDTFSMVQEFETALGEWPDREAGFWPVVNAPVNKMLNSPEVYQDPYRKLVYASSAPKLKALSGRVNDVIRQGIEAADILVLTLGLIEVWQHTGTGRYLCKPPGTGYGGGIGQAKFRQSTFLDNYTNMRRLLDLLFAKYPKKEVVISVSPVPLDETYTAFDVGTANTESKSTLRAVAGQICREYDRVTYFPSYEMATILGVKTFEEDGRHVHQPVADWIVQNFVTSFT